MTFAHILFLIVGAVALLSALMVVTTRNMVRAALWLIVTLFSVAVLYVLLNAGFFAVVQVVVYIGAIAILFIFAVMLTRNVTAENDESQTNRSWPLAAFLGGVLFVAIFMGMRGWPGFTSLPPALADDTPALRELGMALVSPDAYVIPFEIASVLLVAAMVGAIYMAWGKR